MYNKKILKMATPLVVAVGLCNSAVLVNSVDVEAATKRTTAQGDYNNTGFFEYGVNNVFTDNTHSSYLKEAYTLDGTNYFGVVSGIGIESSAISKDGRKDVLAVSKDGVNWEVLPHGYVDGLAVSDNLAIVTVYNNTTQGGRSSYYSKNGIDWYDMTLLGELFDDNFGYMNNKFMSEFTYFKPTTKKLSSAESMTDGYAYSFDGFNWIDVSDDIHKKYGYDTYGGMYNTPTGLVYRVSDDLVLVGTISGAKNDVITWKEKKIPAAKNGYTYTKDAWLFDGTTFRVFASKGSDVICYETTNFDKWVESDLINIPNDGSTYYDGHRMQSKNKKSAEAKLDMKVVGYEYTAGTTYVAVNGVRKPVKITCKGNVLSGEASTVTEGGLLFDLESGEYIGTKKDIVIPNKLYGEAVEMIVAPTFAHKGLTSVQLPTTLKEIYGDELAGAFEGNKLSEIVIPDSVEYIGGDCFSYNQLSKVKFGKSVSQIEVRAFANNKLTSITLPNSLTTLGQGAFLNNKLTSVQIPKSVKYISLDDLGEEPIKVNSIDDFYKYRVFDRSVKLVFVDKTTDTTTTTPAYSVKVNGKTSTSTPIVQNGVSFVPARDFVEKSLGGKVEYNAKKGTLTVYANKKAVTFTEGSRNYYVDGVKKSLPANSNPLKKSNTLYLPVTPLCQSLGYSVGYDKASNAIIVK